MGSAQVVIAVSIGCTLNEIDQWTVCAVILLSDEAQPHASVYVTGCSDANMNAVKLLKGVFP